MELYKLHAADLFKGINLKKLDHVKMVESAARKFEELYLRQYGETRDDRELMEIADDVMVVLQEDSIRDLIKELCFYKALAITLDTKIRAAEAVDALRQSKEDRRESSLQ